MFKKIEEEMHKQVREMLDMAIIEPSTGDQSSPVVMLRRMAAIGSALISGKADAYSFPHMNDILRNCRKVHLDAGSEQRIS